MSTPCAVTWCCAMAAVDSEFCAVHKAHPTYTPAPARDPQHPDACDDCGGTGNCSECDGEGEYGCECEACGDEHSTECAECDGTGDCNGCDGTGKVE